MQLLPESPGTYASVVANFIQQASPRTQADLHKKGVRHNLDATLDESLMSSIQESVSQASKTKEGRQQMYSLVKSSLRSVPYGYKTKLEKWIW